jgi:signal transduction histidine kinase
VLAQSGALLLLAEVVRRRRQQVIRRLLQRINQMREEEQRHIARELHDNIGQRLSLLSIQLGSLSDRRSSNAIDANELGELMQEVDELISEVHNLSHSMHSAKLEYLGLEDALAEMCRTISLRHHIDVYFQLDGTRGNQGPELSLGFYRIAQEALNNVIKHSGATRVRVTLSRTSEHLTMQICDNGIGFDVAKAATCSGLGLASIGERVLSLHGTLSVDSSPGEGTSISVVVSLDHRCPSDFGIQPEMPKNIERDSRPSQAHSLTELQRAGF